MVQLPIDVREEHLEKIKTFCKKNNIIWGPVYSECWLDGAIGTPEDVEKVKKYNNKLEKEYIRKRKDSSFWYKLFY